MREFIISTFVKPEQMTEFLIWLEKCPVDNLFTEETKEMSGELPQ